jgi:hypothetical protein
MSGGLNLLNWDECFPPVIVDPHNYFRVQSGRCNPKNRAESPNFSLCRGFLPEVDFRDKIQTSDRMQDRGMSWKRDALQSRDRSRDRDVRSHDMNNRGGISKGSERGSAFSGMDRGGKAARDISSRGRSIRQSMSSGSHGSGKSRGGSGVSRGGSRNSDEGL